MPDYRLVTAAELRTILETSASSGDGAGLPHALAFDADGTLWSHDVGCMVYDFAWSNRLLHDVILEPLRQEFRHNSLHFPEDADQNELARLLGEAFARGECDDQRFAEMQVWCYAGRTEEEMDELTRAALQHGRHSETLHSEVLAIAEWARERRHQTLVVSASPRSIVRVAVEELGFHREDVSGGVPAVEAGSIQTYLAEPLPYGPEKVQSALRRVGSVPLLAGFGDSTFDLDLLRAAKVGVGLGKKPAFLSGLERIEGSVYLTNP